MSDSPGSDALRRRVLPAVALLLGAAPAACGGDETRPTGAAPEVFVEGASQVMVGLTTWITRDGIRSATLEADTAYTFDEEGRLELRTVTLTFFGEAGDTLGVLAGDSAVYSIAEGDVRVRGNVEVRMQDGETLVAPMLDYLRGPNVIRADSGYVYTLSDGTVDRGSYLVYDVETEEREYGPGRTTTPEIAVPQ